MTKGDILDELLDSFPAAGYDESRHACLARVRSCTTTADAKELFR